MDKLFSGLRKKKKEPVQLLDILRRSDLQLHEDVKSCLITPATRVQVGKTMGWGKFGLICSGQLQGRTDEELARKCAVRTLHSMYF